MSELHRVVGRKQKVAHIEDALAIVRRRWPSATKDGSMASWSFMVGDKMVAEAWMPRSAKYWWLRVQD